MTFTVTSKILQEAVTSLAFPSGVIEVGRHDQVLWRESFGKLSYDSKSPKATENTIFDLASLTKVLATTTLMMMFVEKDRISLDDLVSKWLSDWRGFDQENVTFRDLLSHSSGLTNHLPFYRDHSGRLEFQRAICTMPLEYVPKSQSIYSDLGFILLGFVLEDLGGSGLDQQFDSVVNQIGLGEIRFRPPRDWRARIAPTEIDAWRGRLLVGEVHDGNAWALNGVAGHTGLFGSVNAVGRFAQTILDTFLGKTSLIRQETLTTFIKRGKVPGSSRALGWDTMLPTSSCGQRMSAQAFGHTGFTGTSLWIDPAEDIYIVLLTNRVNPSRDNDAILRIRPAVHNSVMLTLQK